MIQPTLHAITLSAALLCGMTTPLNPTGSAPSPAEDVLVFYSAGLDGLLVDPRDQGLKNALRLIDDRIMELPAELDEPEIPAPAFQLVLDMLAQPMTFRAGILPDFNPAVDPEDHPPFYAQWNVLTEDGDYASDLAGRFSGMLNALAPFPSQPANLDGFPGLQMIDLDGVPLFHGRANLGDSPGFTLALNEINDEPPFLGKTGLPDGVEPALGFRLNFGGLKPLLQLIEEHEDEMDGGEQAIIKMQLGLIGLNGDNPLVISGACGYGTDRSYGSVRVENFTEMAEQWGMDTDSFLTANDLKFIPRDATHAQVARFDFGGYCDAMLKMFSELPGMDMEENDPLAMVEAMTGIHPKRDLIDHLGDTIGWYMSDTTGGGLLGLVVFAEIDNPEGIQQTFDQLYGMANQMAGQMAKGYIQFRTRTIDGRTFTTLTFPGLPVPLEFSLGQSSGYFFAAASPQALLAAMDQAEHGKTNLNQNPHFQEMGGKNLQGAIKVTFMDTPRLIQGGYGLTSLGMAALANATRSPVDSNRDAGIIMPRYHDLMKTAKASVTINRIVGNDMIVEVQGDRSFLANISGVLGSIGGPHGLALAALGAGMAMPAMAKARHHAEMLQEQEHQINENEGVMRPTDMASRFFSFLLNHRKVDRATGQELSLLTESPD